MSIEQDNELSGATTSLLEIVNATDVDICEIMIAPSASEAWGDNLLQNTLAPGESITFSDVEADFYDFLAVDCDEEESFEAFAIELSDQEVVWQIGTDIQANEDQQPGANDEETLVEQDNEPTEASQPIPSFGENDNTWLVLLYQNADDEILEQDIFIDLNEAEMVGSTDQVTIIAQLDRYQEAFEGDGDWTSAKRFLVTEDNDLTRINSTELDDLGEVDSGDWQTLVDFATWAIQNYPANKYVLILSDHGAGWLGGWNDDDPVEGSAFSTDNIDQALRAIIEQTGIEQFELVGFDACLMSQLEPLYSLVPYTKVAVASEETEPSLGWAYASFLHDLVDNPGMSSTDLGKLIVDSYIIADGRIMDDEARSVFVEENFDFEGETTAEEVVQEITGDITLTAADLSAIPDLNAAFNNLALALADADQRDVAEARAYAQSFESVFGDDDPSPYLDLGHFTLLLQDTLSENVKISEATQNLLNAINKAIIAEKHGPDRPGATGFTFYFPNSALYQYTSDPDTEDPQYTAYASRFAAASLWDNFLLYHYTGQTFSLDDADPTVLNFTRAIQQDIDELDTEISPVTRAIQAPGAGQEISIAPITVSAEEIGLDDVVTLFTEIRGDNVGYIYIYVSYYDEESNSFLTADMDFIGAEDTKEIGGVYYPDWGAEGVGEIEIDWEPTVYYMSDGVNEEFAFFEPETYGAIAEDDTYTVYGIYTFTDNGNQRDAVMQFGSDGKMKSIFGFTGTGGTGAPRQITPRAGDTFTILEEWLEFDQDPEGEFVDYEGGTLTFGEHPFEMVPYYGFPGNYVLGIIVEDINGTTYEEYISITVVE
ncbi:MAG: hypothetical protein JXA33_27570 [Anaerolineae bacterium]|nr:hypothetical protein [Anaerolineae bacterium]